MQYYFIPSEDAKAGYVWPFIMSPPRLLTVHITYDPVADLWFGTTAGHFAPPSIDVNESAPMNDPWETMRLQLLSGALDCFRVNEDGSPFQAPTGVVHSRIDVPCFNESCRRPNEIGFASCWFCGCPAKGYSK